jgi:hypothetical protein
MKAQKRNVATEMIADLKQINAALKSGRPLHEKFTVRTVRAVQHHCLPLRGTAFNLLASWGPVPIPSSG